MNADNVFIIFARLIILIFILAVVFLFTTSKTQGLKPYYYSGFSLFCFYLVYVASGLSFTNGISLGGEFLYAVMIFLFMFGLMFGSGFGSVSVPSKGALAKKFVPVRKGFAVLSILIFVGYLILLTDGNPFRIFFDATELKHKRLNLILVAKDFKLIFIESLFVALISIGSIWSIVGHGDDGYSDKMLLLYISLVILQVISTGARSPLIGFAVIFIFSVNRGKKHSKKVWFYSKIFAKTIPLITLIVFGYMIKTTSSRIDFEGLDLSVFQSYFNIVDFGVSRSLFEDKSGLQFFVGTTLAYISSTFNNFIIKYQQLGFIDPTFGYSFLFPYVSFLDLFIGDKVTHILDWKNMAADNNLLLVNVSESATQWSTIFGDYIWNFGIMVGCVVLTVISIVFGYIASRAQASLNVFLVVASIYTSANLALGIVNPFGSLEFHMVFFILTVMSYIK
jgi:hypothetical protein